MTRVRPAAALTLLLAFGSVTIPTPLRAADVPPARPPLRAPAYLPFFSWSGFYFGLAAGYGFGTSNWTAPSTGATSGDFNVGGALVGATAGYNMQMRAAVFGVEGDISWTGIKGSSTAAVCLGACESKNTWLATARGRIGYAFDRFLPYVTGGAAFGDIRIADGSGAASATRAGWTLGGGLEYAFHNAWSTKLEYIYVDLGTATCGAGCTAGAAFDVKLKSNVVRAGVNYRF
jgi:outer membrane immunogenic protein